MSYSVLAKKSKSVATSKAKTSAQTTFSGLRIGEPTDALELEADQMANWVTSPIRRNLDSSVSSVDTAHPVHNVCNPSQSKIMRKAADANTSSTPSVAPTIVHEVLHSIGKPLDAPARGYFEPRFNYDLGKVRIHDDEKAAESARSVGAVAYTVGNHLAFGKGEYAPHSASGRKLLAHELAHVLQGNKNCAGQSWHSNVHSLKSADSAEAGSRRFLNDTDADWTKGGVDQRGENILLRQQQTTQQSPSTGLRPLTEAENRFVDPPERRRMDMSLAAVKKLVEMIQDIVTGDPDLLRSTNETQNKPIGQKAAGNSKTGEASVATGEKERVRRAVRQHLNLGYDFGWGRSSYDYLNDPRALKAFTEIQTATNMIIYQAARNLPRQARVQTDPRSLAEKPMGQDIIVFDPEYFNPNHWKTELCWTFVVMHEYMHYAGAFHGEDIHNGLQKFPDYKPEFALADADHLTELVFDLASGKPFETDCHHAGT
jgi:hypothetical protein